MSCPRSTASTVPAAICLRASGFRWVARVRRGRAPCPPFQPTTRLWRFEGLSVKHRPVRPVPSEGNGHTFESCRARHFGTAKASLACAASSRILAATPRRHGPQPKISKTTPCKVAGGRRQGRFGGQYLTRRANQRHSFIIAQSVKRAWSRNGALFGVIWAKIPTHD